MKLFAFDCFGTVFDMSPIPRSDIAAYVAHVRKNDFTPFEFPQSWFELKAHPDAKEGIQRLRSMGYQCVTLSNGSRELLERVSQQNGIEWDKIIDLASHRVYKPHVDAYKTVERETGILPRQCCMVTANPTFGDIEGAAAIEMESQVIRHGYPNTIIELAEMIEDSEKQSAALIADMKAACGLNVIGLSSPMEDVTDHVTLENIADDDTWFGE